MPVVEIFGTVSPCGRVYVLATTVVVVSLVDTGPPRTSPLRLGRSGRESVMAMEGFCQNATGPPEWECEAMGSVVWVQYATSVECIIYR